MDGALLFGHTRTMKTSQPSPTEIRRQLWLLRPERFGIPTLLYVTGIATAFIVIAISALAITGHAWMVGVAFAALAVAVAAVSGFMGLMLGDSDGGLSAES